jgi:predicted transcriptional regulator
MAIIYAVLSGLARGDYKTYQCCQMAYITTKKATKVLEYLQEYDVVSKVSDNSYHHNSNDSIWKITPKGLRILDMLREMRDIFGENNVLMFEDPIFDPKHRNTLF